MKKTIVFSGTTIFGNYLRSFYEEILLAGNKKTLKAKIGVLLLVAGLAILLDSDFGIGGDGLSRYESAIKVFEGKGLDNSKYSITGALFSFPLWIVSRLAGTDAHNFLKYYNFILLIATIVFLYLFQVRRKIWSFQFLIYFSIILLSCSMFTVHVHEFYGEVFSALLTFCGIILLTEGFFFSGAILCILSVVNIPPAMPGMIGICFFFLISRRQFRFLIIPIISVTLILLEMYLRKDFRSGYEGDAGNGTLLPYSGKPGFSYPFFFGLISILLSFGKGLVFFSPGILLKYKKNFSSDENQKSNREIYIASVIFLIGLILIYSKWWSWYGGWFWGPRFFLFSSILSSFLISVNLMDKRKSFLGNSILIAVVLFSLWVGFSGLFFGQKNMEICTQDNYQMEYLCWYTPEFSALWRPFVSGSDLLKYEPYFFYWISVSIYLLVNPVSSLFKNVIRYSCYIKTVLLKSKWKI